MISLPYDPHLLLVCQLATFFFFFFFTQLNSLTPQVNCESSSIHRMQAVNIYTKHFGALRFQQHIYVYLFTNTVSSLHLSGYSKSFPRWLLKTFYKHADNANSLKNVHGKKVLQSSTLTLTCSSKHSETVYITAIKLSSIKTVFTSSKSF